MMFKIVFICATFVLAASAIQSAELPADVAAEVAKFKDANPKVRQQGLTALGKLGAKAKPAVPNINEMLSDKTTWVATRAMMVLAEVGPDESSAKPIAPFLATGPDVRTFAVDVLVMLKEKSVPVVIEALKDDKSAEGGCEVLQKIGSAGKGAAAQLAITAKTTKSAPVKDACLKAIKAINK
jgi:HEAT repeat protein